MRNYSVKIVHMLNDDEFIGMLLHPRFGESACYAWSKGAGFYIYQVQDGHITKLGTLARTEVDTLRSAMV